MARISVNKGSVRRSQLVGTYGVGAIVAVKDESFMVAGLDAWTVGRPDIHEPRLEQQLHVHGFNAPPAHVEGRKDTVPVVRFPRYYSCPKCHRLDLFRKFNPMGENKCPTCRVDLIPSRFVVACTNGHIDDFPYWEWVHRGGKPIGGDQPTKHELTINVEGATGALRDIVIRCSCGKASTMQGAFGKNAMKPVIGCTGNRPWLRDHEECAELPRTLQRGASNVHFPITRSSLSIPPWSEGVMKTLNSQWQTLSAIPDAVLPVVIDGMKLAKDTGFSIEMLVMAVKKRKAEFTPNADDEIDGDGALRPAEYEALCIGRAEESSADDFVCVPARITPDVRAWFDSVMLVTRLREVRVLTAFTRLLPPTPSDLVESGDVQVVGHAAPLAHERTDWLPAIEVNGEGVFFRLDASRLAEWEVRPEVQRRVAPITENYHRSLFAASADPEREVTPRLVMIHTLAHALITQWSLTSGYPAASLRERLYVSDEMAGVLIYTATSDAAGSMGGVVSMAGPKVLGDALHEAISRVAWCSADPLCIEAEATGVDSLNLAACHACVLLPEPSCEERNTLLDRALLIGTPDYPDLGFFAAILTEV